MDACGRLYMSLSVNVLRRANRGAFLDSLRTSPRGNRQPRDPQGTIGRPQRHTGATCNFPGKLKIHIKQLNKQVWGPTSTPTWVPGPYNQFGSGRISCIPTTKSFPHKSVFIGTPKSLKKGPQATMSTWGSQNTILAAQIQSLA